MPCLVAVLLAVGGLLGPGHSASTGSDARSLSVIVQASDLASAAHAVRSVGGTITHELGIIDAVGARLTAARLEALRRSREVRRIYANRTVKAAARVGSAKQTDETFYPTLVGAARLHGEGIDGRGITVAVVDTGMYAGSVAHDWLRTNTNDVTRIMTKYDAVRNEIPTTALLDRNGHGTHVTSVIASRKKNEKGKYQSIAPNVNLVIVKAFDVNGSGTYLNVIRGIDFIVRNRDVYKIRVLNLSFSAPPRSHYWDDPLNQAVMRAWQAGIVVVVSAGNGGPNPMTVGVPGNVPYVITVGAMTDNYTPGVPGDDFLASFSATGPTVEGFVKPELVAPGGHIVGLMEAKSLLATTHDVFRGPGGYFKMSGTSQAAAVVSGIAALVLQREPGLSPDEVKCRLMATARPAVDPSGKRAYSVFQQGAGLVDAYAAAHSGDNGCANLAMDISLDLAGTTHYGGPANRAEDGTYYLMGLEGDGYVWNGGYLWSDGYLWSSASLWSDAYLWSGGYLWSDSYLWSDAYLWSGGYLWSNGFTETMSVNKWVNQE